jgi:hypothetical protein
VGLVAAGDSTWRGEAGGDGDPSALPFRRGLKAVSMVERLRVALRLSKGESLCVAAQIVGDMS